MMELKELREDVLDRVKWLVSCHPTKGCVRAGRGYKQLQAVPHGPFP